MYVLDGINNITMSTDEVCSLDRDMLSDPMKFRSFAEGIELNEDFLVNPRWQESNIGSKNSDMLNFVVFEMLPVIYSADVLDKAGGSFAARISGVCEFTLILINHRVVVINGLPIDFETNNSILDFEISPEVFSAHCRYLLLNISEKILEDDEFEHKDLSNNELRMMGMPAGGRSESDDRYMYHVNSGRLEAHGDVVHGTIDTDFITFQAVAGQSYTIELKGKESGQGTLTDPMIKSIRDARGNEVHGGNDDGGEGLESKLTFNPTEDGVYTVEVGAFGHAKGTYTLSAETAAVDTDGFETFQDDQGVYVTTGVVDFVRDKDWIEMDAVAGTTYELYMSGTDRTNSLSDARIYALYDSNGNEVHSGDDDSGHGLDSKLEFTAETSGKYYIEVGGFGTQKGAYELTSRVVAIDSQINVDSGPLNVHYCTNNAGVAGDCTANVSSCYNNAGVYFNCTTNASSCFTNSTVAFVGGVDAWACGLNASGVFVGGVNASACAANGTAGVWVCGTNASACAANGFAGVGGCGVNASAYAVSAGAGVYGCATNAGAGAISIHAVGVGGCATNVNACGVDVSIPCALDSVACVINLSWGIDSGVCAINIFPLLPSC